jgi:hypothetical protein
LFPQWSDRMNRRYSAKLTSPTNNTAPEAFVVAYAWNQLVIRYMVEHGRFGVFDIDIDPATRRPRELPRGGCPGFVLSVLLSHPSRET